MENIISKELLSEVLDYEVEDFEYFKNGIYINETDMMSEFVTTNGRYDKYINIHELAHKCILHFYNDFIFSINAYTITVTRIYTETRSSEIVYTNSWYDTPYKIDEIFKACQWIIDNKDKL